MGRLWIVAASFGISLSVQAAGPADWLVEMSQAVRTSNFEGVMIYRGESSLETFRVLHRYQDNEERERIQSLTGEHREIVRIGDTVTCLLPRNRRMSSAAQHAPQNLFPVLSAAQLTRISQVYRLEDLGQQRIAGRQCQGVAIVPRDQFRYGYEIWADSETRVPIKVTLRDHAGNMLEQMMFTEVSFPEAIPDSAFVIDPERTQGLETVVQERAQPPGALLARAADLASDAQTSPWQLRELPPGFEVVMHVDRALPQGVGRLQHWVVSDGLTAVSVFGRDTAVDAESASPQPFSSMGAVNAYRRSLDRFHITVVGEVPRQTIQVIADGLQRREPAP